MAANGIDIEKLEREHVILEASSDIGIKELFGTIKRRSRGRTIQIFDPSCIISKTHIIGAYINAMLVFREGANLTKSRSMEMLLFVAMSKKIDEAIKLAGAKSNSSFIIFCDSKSSYERVSDLISKTHQFRASSDESSGAAKRLGVASTDDKSVLEAMTLSRLYE
jgi:tRNA threonylcarbamoyladenosine modification (KEOPS) complex Cgi121 subunit